MKNIALTLCIAGTALIALSACEARQEGNVETAAPYSSERTAGNEQMAERVFRRVQTK